MMKRTLTAFVAGLLAFASSQTARAQDDKPIRALFVTGGCCHDYTKQKDIITQGISARANVQWVISYNPADGKGNLLNPIYEKPDFAKDFDVILHDECDAAVTDAKSIDTILAPHKAGLPGVVIHCGMHCYRTDGWNKKGSVTPWFEFTGLQTTAHGSQLPISIAFLDKANPITSTLTDWTTIGEELYNNFDGKLFDTAHALAKGKQTHTVYPKGANGKEDKTQPGKEVVDETVVVWTNLYNNKAKVFATTLGHNNATCADPRYLDLVTRGLLWSVDKLDDAHMKPAKQVMIDGSAPTPVK